MFNLIPYAFPVNSVTPSTLKCTYSTTIVTLEQFKYYKKQADKLRIQLFQNKNPIRYKYFKREYKDKRNGIIMVY